jgi:hypothetical protein
MKLLITLITGALTLCLIVPVFASPHTAFDPAMQTLLGNVRVTDQFDYVMTGKVRLLLFWVSGDDVGGGYIRRGTSPSDSGTRFLQVLFGSDPMKAPRHINYWGAATEAINPASNSVLGFMRSASTGSAGEAEAEIRKQREHGQYGFQASISVVDEHRAISRVMPLFSNIDFTLRELQSAQQLIVRQLSEDRPIRQLAQTDRNCKAVRGFLQSVEDLVDQAVAGKVVPASHCYTYNSLNYTVTLDERSRVAAKNVTVKLKTGRVLERKYTDLLRTRFSVLNHQSRETTTFELLVGTTGKLRGVPVQIVHQPNWWFQVVLNLC